MFNLIVFHTGILFDPLYHESFYNIYRTRTRFTKIHSFFFLPRSSKATSDTFFKIFEILDTNFFGGPQALGKDWTKITKIPMMKGCSKKYLSKIWDKKNRFKEDTLCSFPIFEVSNRRWWSTWRTEIEVQTS